jgi:hypothetical protein
MPSEKKLTIFDDRVPAAAQAEPECVIFKYLTVNNLQTYKVYG